MNTASTAPGTTAPSTERATRQAEVVQALLQHLPAHALLWHTEDTTPYECDGLTAYRQRPLVVALPETEAQVAAVLKACHAVGAPVVARGAGTGLSGGAMPHPLGVTLSLAKFNKIVKVDPVSRTAIVANCCTAAASSPPCWPQCSAPSNCCSGGRSSLAARTVEGFLPASDPSPLASGDRRPPGRPRPACRGPRRTSQAHAGQRQRRAGQQIELFAQRRPGHHHPRLARTYPIGRRSIQ